MTLYRALSAAALLLLIIVTPGHSETFTNILRVCPQGCPYQTIQAAVDASTGPDDLIQVSPGRYSENLVITKSIVLYGTASAEQVIVEAKEPGKPTVMVLNSDRSSYYEPIQVRFQNLTITGARGGLPGSQCAGGELDLCPDGLYIATPPGRVTTPSGETRFYWNSALVTIEGVQIVANERDGIRLSLTGQVNLVLMRSRIRENGLNGLAAHFLRGGQVACYDSEISDNKGDGVDVSSAYLSSTMQFGAFGSRFINNGTAGIRAENADLSLSNIVVQGNASSGIKVTGYSTLSLSQSTIEANGIGILARARSFITGVRVTKNREVGIIAAEVLYLSKSVIAENGRQSIIYFNSGPGIDVERYPDTRAFLSENEVRDNAGFGIMAESAESLEQCVNNKLTGNGLGSYNPAAAQKCQ